MRAIQLTPDFVIADPERLVKQISDHVLATTGFTPGTSERNSWRKSLPPLAQDLIDTGLKEVQMLVECRLPYSNKRADVVLAGLHPQTGEDSYVVVELKQWTSARIERDDSDSVVVPGSRRMRHPHPIDQVRGYCEYLRDYLVIFGPDDTTIHGAAYLHDAKNTDVDGLFNTPSDDDGRLFTLETRDDFRDFLRSRFARRSGLRAANRFLQSATRPSRKLMEYASDVVRNRDLFVRVDEQIVAYRKVMAAVTESRAADTKQVVIITGGPGSGKSVIALSALGELFRQERPVAHATGSSAFTRTLRTVVGKGERRVEELFKFFNELGGESKNELDALICDEAHRIRRFSSRPSTEIGVRGPALQLDELLDAARVPVFLLDEHQVVKPDEVGTVDFIMERARAKNLNVNLIDLDGQFRCGGSRAYEEWVLHLLGLKGDAPIAWQGDENFELSVVDSPEELERIIKDHSDIGETARMTAGYCWPWSMPDGNRLRVDVKIGGWHKPWNVQGKKRVGTAPPSPLWATDPGGVGQVGCVYTAQGFEYSWNGVILGPDIVARNGKLIPDRSKNLDEKNLPRDADDAAIDRHIRNIYKVLLTRGMRGTVIYSVDEETRAFLAGIMKPSPKNAG